MHKAMFVDNRTRGIAPHTRGARGVGGITEIARQWQIIIDPIIGSRYWQAEA